METKGSPHTATTEYGFKCTGCGAVQLFAMFNDISNESVWTDCKSCDAEEVKMEKVDLSKVLERDKFSLHLRQFVSEEVEGSMGLTREAAVEELRELADDIENNKF